MLLQWWLMVVDCAGEAWRRLAAVEVGTMEGRGGGRGEVRGSRCGGFEEKEVGVWVRERMKATAALPGLEAERLLMEVDDNGHWGKNDRGCGGCSQ